MFRALVSSYLPDAGALAVRHGRRPRARGAELLMAPLALLFQLGLAGMAAAVVIGMLAAALSVDPRGDALPVLSFTALALLALRPFLDGVPGPVGGTRGPVAAALAMALVAALFGLLALAAIDIPLVHGTAREAWPERGGLREALGAFAIGVVAATAGAALLAARPGLDRHLAGAARVATAAGAVLVLLAAVATVLHPHAASRYLASRPAVATLPPLANPPPPQWAGLGAVGGAAVFEMPVGDGLRLRARCFLDCGFALRRPGEAAPGEGRWSRDVEVNVRRPLVLRRDAANGLLVLSGGADAAFRERDRAAVDVAPAALGGRVRPPLGWTLAAAAGVLLAAVMLRPGRRRDADTALLEAREGRLDAEGWVRFPQDLAPIRPQVAMPPGPVVVLTAPQAAAGYRDAGPLSGYVVPGTLSHWQDAVRDAASLRHAYALAAVALTAAPLAMALVRGLIRP